MLQDLPDIKEWTELPELLGPKDRKAILEQLEQRAHKDLLVVLAHKAQRAQPDLLDHKDRKA